MNKTHEKKCLCGSNFTYEKCCKLLHTNIKFAKTAKELMKSRFTAFAHGQIEYIINTTHQENPDYTNDKKIWTALINDFIISTSFEKLKILDFVTYDRNNASVIFKASLKKDFEDISFTEKSYFEKVNGKWLYKYGEFLEEGKQ